MALTHTHTHTHRYQVISAKDLSFFHSTISLSLSLSVCGKAESSYRLWASFGLACVWRQFYLKWV